MLFACLLWTFIAFLFVCFFVLHLLWLACACLCQVTCKPEVWLEFWETCNGPISSAAHINFDLVIHIDG